MKTHTCPHPHIHAHRRNASYGDCYLTTNCRHSLHPDSRPVRNMTWALSQQNIDYRLVGNKTNTHIRTHIHT